MKFSIATETILRRLGISEQTSDEFYYNYDERKTYDTDNRLVVNELHKEVTSEVKYCMQGPCMVFNPRAPWISWVDLSLISKTWRMSGVE